MNTLSPLKQETVKFEEYELVLAAATGEIGVYRTILRQNAVDEEAVEDASHPELEKDLKRASVVVLHTLMYPAMVAAAVEHKGFDHWPPTFEEFRNLPEELIAEWEVVTFRLNDHWRPQPVEKAVARKKGTRSTKGSSNV